MYQQCLLNLQSFLVDNMTSVYDALDAIVSTGCLDDDEYQRIIHKEKTPRDQVRTLIEVLRNKGQKGFDGLVDGLNKKNKSFVSKKLKQEVKKIEEEGLPACSAKTGWFIFFFHLFLSCQYMSSQ